MLTLFDARIYVAIFTTSLKIYLVTTYLHTRSHQVICLEITHAKQTVQSLIYLLNTMHLLNTSTFYWVGSVQDILALG